MFEGLKKDEGLTKADATEARLLRSKRVCCSIQCYKLRSFHLILVFRKIVFRIILPSESKNSNRCLKCCWKIDESFSSWQSNKPYECKICKAIFGQNITLNKHVAEVYNGMKPFKCK